MSLDSFIPTIWSREVLTALRKRHVFAQAGVINRNYEGEIRAAGDSVKINSIGPVTIGNYTKNTNIDAPEALDAAQSWLTIDQQKYFNFQVDDIDAVQANTALMPEAMANAGYGLANTVDQFLNTTMVAGLAASNTLGTTAAPKTISDPSDAYEYLVDLRTLLQERNVPEEMRWCIMPAWFESLLLKDDRFTEAPMASPFTNVPLNGQVKFLAGMNLMSSNNTTHETAGGTGVVGEYSYVLAGHPMACSFAEQIVEVEAYRPELRFGDAVKGLHVYGGKVIRPEALVALIVDRPA